MPNPLRLPIVLIVILATMALYVHSYHRSQTGGPDSVAPIHDRLQLRQPPGRSPVSSSLSESPLKRPSPREATDGRVSESTTSADTSRGLPLPRIDVPRGEAPPSAQPAATLSGPIQFPSASTSAVSAPATAPLGSVAAPAVSANPTYSPGDEPPRQVVMHRVVDGDSLPKLAERYLGDERRAGEILEANRDILVHPDLLPLGVRLRIPTSP